MINLIGGCPLLVRGLSGHPTVWTLFARLSLILPLLPKWEFGPYRRMRGVKLTHLALISWRGL